MGELFHSKKGGLYEKNSQNNREIHFEAFINQNITFEIVRNKLFRGLETVGRVAFNAARPLFGS